MTVQFGLWNFNGSAINTKVVTAAKKTLIPYASEGMTEFPGGEIHLLYIPFQVTRESAQEIQPLQTRSGHTMLWDGRLDNRQELIRALGTELQCASTDAEIASVALELWGIAGLAKLVGDWALSVWNPLERTVLLAKDFLGSKALYYSIKDRCFAWSTLLDPLVLQNSSFQLNEEYLAGWLTHFPGSDLTPFVGIKSVPPCSYVLFQPESTRVREYWNFEPGKKIAYRDDREYEEHFRAVFGESVRRRLRSTSPVLSELSGGMDSSSIVCMADALAARGLQETPRLDTISYYDDSEPNWNESPFFRKVEQRRGRTGCHVAFNFQNHWNPIFDPSVFAGTPASGINFSENADYVAHLRSGAYQVLLTGIGGDEVLGGVPTPIPELADLLVGGRIRNFITRLTAWAVSSRVPAVHLLRDTLRLFLPSFISRDRQSLPPWLCGEFVKRNTDALNAYPRRFRVFGSSPSFQANIIALDALRRQIAATGFSPTLRIERRYPFLDRDLLEFLYAIPRDQIVRPNQRRSLMRRALVDIVPSEILNRRRKAFIARAPLISLHANLQHLLDGTKHMTSSGVGIVEAGPFRACLDGAASGKDLPIVPAWRTLLIEAWLTHLSNWAGNPSHSPAQNGGRLILSSGDSVNPNYFFS
jgi:asparagine synthase (glutamine-hydrolysing)